MDNNLPSTVQLDVGGTIYKVSRSLLESFPDTMLARMVSETWQKDPNKPIFVERDGESFRYVLHYMRDGHVFLPITMSKDAVLKDLEYYGFDNVDPN